MSTAPLTRLTLIAAVLCLAALPSSAQSQVWTVSKTEPADFNDLQPAIDAAAPGDVVHVLGGAYDNVVIEGKGITLLGNAGTGIIDLTPVSGQTQPALTIRGVPADQTCIVSGPQIFLGHVGPSGALLVEDCAGAVWLQDLFVDSYGAAALRTTGSSSVVATNSFFQTNAGAALPDGTPQSAPGAWVLDGSTLYGYDADFAGSHSTLQFGGAPTPNAPAKGGDGLMLADSLAQLSGGVVSGARGTTLFLDGCQHGGDGGHGVNFLDDNAFLLTRDTFVGAGEGGSFDTSCAAPTRPGLQVAGDPSHALFSSATARTLSAPALVSPGETLNMELNGDPGDLAFLFVANEPAAAAAAAGITLHLDTSTLKLLTTLGMPTGTRSLNLLVPPLPAGLSGLMLPVQAAMLASDGSRHEAGPRALVVL